MPTHQLMPKGSEPQQPPEICLFAQTNYRGQMRRFGIKTDDRRRHMYVVGKTGMGKTTMMENMVLNDIYRGHGVGIVDPHGDFAEKIINFIPASRINDVVYFNPADTDFPIGFNILEVKSEEQQHLIAAGLMGTFKKIWPDVWSSRMEYILNNTILALLDYPGSTLLGINRMLGEKDYRKKVVRQLHDPVVKSFWQNEFENYEPRYQKEAVAPIQNKIGQFLSASVIRNMVAQVKSTINVREIMDSRKIFIMNLSKGRIGEDNSRLLGGMLITKLQLSAMERVDTIEADRKDFFLYVDEFQNFATPSFANILSEARKYRLSLIMAHQYVKQLDEIVADAVFGNVGTIVSFRVGGGDAEVLAKEYAPIFLEENIVNLSKFSVIMKLMIDGVASQPFTAQTMPPIGSPTGSSEKVIRVSRERYARNKSIIEEKILRWSGMGELKDDDDDYDEEAELAKATVPDSSYDDYDGDEAVVYKEEVYEKEKKPAEKKEEPASNTEVRRPDTSRQDASKKEERPREERREKNDRRDGDKKDNGRRDRDRSSDKKIGSEKPKEQSVSIRQLLSDEDKASLSELAREVVQKQVERSQNEIVAPVVEKIPDQKESNAVIVLKEQVAQPVESTVVALIDQTKRTDNRNEQRQENTNLDRDRSGDQQRPQMQSAGNVAHDGSDRKKRKRRRKKKTGEGGNINNDGRERSNNQQQNHRADDRPRNDQPQVDVSRPQGDRPVAQQSGQENRTRDEDLQSKPASSKAQSIKEDEIITFD